MASIARRVATSSLCGMSPNGQSSNSPLPYPYRIEKLVFDDESLINITIFPIRFLDLEQFHDSFSFLLIKPAINRFLLTLLFFNPKK